MPISSLGGFGGQAGVTIAQSRRETDVGFAADSLLEEAVTSEPVSGKRPENSLPGGKNKTLGSRSNSPENGTPSGGGGPPTMAFYSRL
jgi:hypothetical protein